jgi:transposase
MGEAKRAAEKALLERHIRAGLSTREMAGRMGWSIKRVQESLRRHDLVARRAEAWEAL